jgi:hypothetical protein
MAGTIVCNTLNTDTGLFSTNNAYLGIAKAWVNWTGSTGAINGTAFNVSSITRNGTGDYTINFTTAMPNANYVVAGMTQIDTGGNVQCGEIGIKRAAGSQTTTIVRITTNNGAQTAVDVAIAMVVVLSS